MSMEQKTHFEIDKSKCVKCGKCVNTCSGMVIEFGPDGYPRMKEFERFGWRGCWRCQHCLAVCPQGAISIFDKRPEDSLPPPPPEMGEYMERLVTNRRSCRRFLDKNVDPEIITRILSAMAAVPTGGNAMGVEYTVIDDNGKRYLITSGTSGYYPNPSRVCAFDDPHGEYRDLGLICEGDRTGTSFSAQFTSVIQLPGTERYIACADRWMPQWYVKPLAKQIISGMKRHFANYVPDTSPQKARPLPAKELCHGENTSISRYVWLPIEWEGEKPVIRWQKEWKL